MRKSSENGISYHMSDVRWMWGGGGGGGGSKVLDEFIIQSAIGSNAPWLVVTPDALHSLV